MTEPDPTGDPGSQRDVAADASGPGESPSLSGKGAQPDSPRGQHAPGQHPPGPDPQSPYPPGPYPLGPDPQSPYAQSPYPQSTGAYQPGPVNPYSAGGYPQAGPTQPGYPGQAWAPARPTNGLAVAALILGIVGLCLGFVVIPFVGAVPALICGYLGRKQIRERGDAGDGMALAGIILGWIGVASQLAWVVFFVFIFAAYPH
ncbi:MAG: DUF4190 domain-containing protein [Pseudonocardiales bacterium]|nr:DUF4190 domain-containing protein [Pseudonocardiales bacterium]